MPKRVPKNNPINETSIVDRIGFESLLILVVDHSPRHQKVKDLFISCSYAFFHTLFPNKTWQKRPKNLHYFIMFLWNVPSYHVFDTPFNNAIDRSESGMSSLWSGIHLCLSTFQTWACSGSTKLLSLGFWFDIKHGLLIAVWYFQNIAPFLLKKNGQVCSWIVREESVDYWV